MPLKDKMFMVSLVDMYFILMTTEAGLISALCKPV